MVLLLPGLRSSLKLLIREKPSLIPCLADEPRTCNLLIKFSCLPPSTRLDAASDTWWPLCDTVFDYKSHYDGINVTKALRCPRLGAYLVSKYRPMPGTGKKRGFSPHRPGRYEQQLGPADPLTCIYPPLQGFPIVLRRRSDRKFSHR